MEIQDVDVIQYFHPITVAFMHAVDADEAGINSGAVCAALASGYTDILVLFTAPRVVRV